MITRAFDRAAMTWSYEMSVQPMLSGHDITGLPFGSVFGSVAPRSVSKRHAHHDGELFIVLSGRAVVVQDHEERELAWGSTVYLPPFSFHEIRNDSDEPFDMVSIYWDHIPSAVATLTKKPPRALLPERSLIFCPPPTPNGGLHLGHLAGPYVRADMLVRALHSMGLHARQVTGTDDYQSFVALAAQRGSVSPQDVAKSEGDAILATLRAAGVTCDRITRPATTPLHAERIGKLFSQVVTSPAVLAQASNTAYCPHCELSLHQAFVRGQCPHCLACSDGEICEACGRPHEARELREASCRICGSTPGTRSEQALWLDLNAYASQLRAYLTRIHAGPDLRLLVDDLLNSPGGLPRYRLTRTTTWGVCWDADTGQAIDAWVDLALTYLDAAIAEADTFGPAKITLFLGYDTSFFYAVLLPALAFATGLDEYLPSALITNKFLNLDGSKFSTSRGHAVWADDALARAGRDAVRLALLRKAPEGRETDLPQACAQRLQDDPLYRESHDWLAGFAALLDEHGRTVPATGAWTESHREFYRYLNSATEQLDGLLLPETFSARGYINILDALLARLKEFRVTETELRRFPAMAEEARTSLALECLGAKAFAALVWPVMPDLGQQIWDCLGLPGAPVRETEWSFLPSGSTCVAT